MRYPIDLVHTYGAKAGILMYVAKQLPDIPQVDMVVKTPDQTIDDALQRADKFPILWPRIFRSSAVAELVGYEGAFPSKELKSFEDGKAEIENPYYTGPYSDRTKFNDFVRFTIESIETSTQQLKTKPQHAHLPDKIAVILAEKSPSSVVGTYVKHPNQNSYYLVSTIIEHSLHPNIFGTIDRLNTNYQFQPNRGLQIIGDSWDYVQRLNAKLKGRIHADLETVLSWHDRITQLPEMEPNWTYQIEFGLDPPCLFQVRPFKPIEIAGFTLPPQPYPYSNEIVVGVTPRNGLNVRVEKNPFKHRQEGVIINPDNQPSALYCNLRTSYQIDDVPNNQVILLADAFGFLAHRDISAMRQSKITVLYFVPAPDLETGDWINVTSDGKQVIITKT